MIRMNVDEQALETGDLIEVVKKIFWYQIFYRDAIGEDIRLMAYQKALYNPKYVELVKLNKLKKLDITYPLVKPLCDTATSTFLGRVPDIVSYGTDQEKKRISKFSLIQKKHDFIEEISDAALQMSICSSGFLCLYNDIGDSFPYYRSLDPLFTNVVYDCSVAMKRLFGYTIYFDTDKNGVGRYVCLIYTKSKIFAYYTPNISLGAKVAFAVYPLQLFQINGAELSNVAEHGYKDIPIIEFINNKALMSDCKPVLTLICLYSALQNNRFKNVDDIMNYLLFIKNARLGNKKEAEDAINLIKSYRVLPVEGDNTDAKFLSNPLNQTDIQKLADRIKQDIHYISHIPDFTSVEFTQNASDPVLKAKTKPLLDLCLEKEKWFNKGYNLVLDLTLDFVKNNDKKLYEQIKFDLDNVDLVYTHTLPSNDIDTTNMIVNLKAAGLAAPRVLLQGLSVIPNVDDYLAEMDEYNKKVLEEKIELNNNKNSGLNENNLEKQNSKPQTKEQEDNFVNATKGQAQKLS